MTVFADSSAIVKRYADEAGHEAVRSLVGPVAVSYTHLTLPTSDLV